MFRKLLMATGMIAAIFATIAIFAACGSSGAAESATTEETTEPATTAEIINPLNNDAIIYREDGSFYIDTDPDREPSVAETAEIEPEIIADPPEIFSPAAPIDRSEPATDPTTKLEVVPSTEPWSAFKPTVDGIVVSLPMPLSEFMELTGYSLYHNPSDEWALSPGGDNDIALRTPGETDYKIVSCEIINLTDDTADPADCTIYYLSSLNALPHEAMVLPGDGITCNTRYDEVLAIMGKEPDEIWEGSGDSFGAFFRIDPDDPDKGELYLDINAGYVSTVRVKAPVK